MRSPERPTGPGAKPPGKDHSGKLAIAALIGLVALASHLGRGGGEARSSDAPMTVSDDPVVSPPETPAPQPSTAAAIEAISRIQVRAGAAMLATIRGADGWDGALVFSRNCHAAIEKAFDWGGLDRCGGFDAAAAARIDDADVTEEAAAWFQSEASAGRYLASASAAGSSPGESDLRWSALTGLVPRPRVVSTVPDEPTDAQDAGPLDDVVPSVEETQNQIDR